MGGGGERQILILKIISGTTIKIFLSKSIEYLSPCNTQGEAWIPESLRMSVTLPTPKHTPFFFLLEILGMEPDMVSCMLGMELYPGQPYYFWFKYKVTATKNQSQGKSSSTQLQSKHQTTVIKTRERLRPDWATQQVLATLSYIYKQTLSPKPPFPQKRTNLTIFLLKA